MSKDLKEPADRNKKMEIFQLCRCFYDFLKYIYLPKIFLQKNNKMLTKLLRNYHGMEILRPAQTLFLRMSTVLSIVKKIVK